MPVQAHALRVHDELLPTDEDEQVVDLELLLSFAVGMNLIPWRLYKSRRMPDGDVGESQPLLAAGCVPSGDCRCGDRRRRYEPDVGDDFTMRAIRALSGCSAQNCSMTSHSSAFIETSRSFANTESSRQS